MWRQDTSAEGFVVSPLSKSRHGADIAGTTDVGACSATARTRFVDRLRARWLQRRLGPLIREGTLRVRLPGAVVVELGNNSSSAIEVRIADARWCWRIAINPGLGLGEAYMDGGLVIEHGALAELVDLIGRNAKYRRTKAPSAASRWWLDRRLQANARRASRQNVAHHYDLSSTFYRRFLGEDLQYSCAYFAHPDVGLEAAQNAKKDHLAAKLLLRPGQSVLDIGCGWGGLALSLAEASDVRVDGVTLSTEQLAIAGERAKQRGLARRVRFSLTDYRDAEGPYDRIVSVGMFEHVGRPNFATYFQQIARLLDEDGVAVIHFIGRAEGPGFTQAWVAKYIFPGGYIPALSEAMSAIESAGLIVTDVEVLRLHYAETLRCWREAFEEHRAEIADLYDERFCRMWEFYLCISESAFRRFDHSVFQIQLAKRIDAVPITRDYISAAEGKAPAAAAA